MDAQKLKVKRAERRQFRVRKAIYGTPAPKALATAADLARAAATDPDAIARIDALVAEGEVAAKAGDADGMRSAIAGLDTLRAALVQTYQLRIVSRQGEGSPTMKAVAALRGGFGGHHVMGVAEGKALRSGEAPKSAKATASKVRPKERPTRAAEKAAARGRKATQAGPSSGTGSTSGGRSAKKATQAGPTSGTGATTSRRRTAR